MVVVRKFGGAAMADGESILRAAQICVDAGKPQVVVVSAMKGVTDLLHEALPFVLKEEGAVLPLVDGLRRRHKEALQWVSVDTGAALDESAYYRVTAILERLERLLYGIRYTGEVTPRLQDLVFSFGERLSTPIMAAALRALGESAVELDAEHAKLRTHGPFGNARPDTAALQKQFRPEIEGILGQGKIPVLTGYYGVDKNDQATLFGRGGSDYIATLVGAVLEANAIQLWKDVPGFLSADPRAVPHAKFLESITYEEAAELAHLGAKVLHARAVEPAQEAGIPIEIRPFLDPSAMGTTICSEPDGTRGEVRSIASRTGLALIKLEGPGMGDTSGLAARIFAPLASAGVNVLNFASSQATLAILIASDAGDTALAALLPLKGGVIREISIEAGKSIVCVVGQGLGKTPGSASRILGIVGDAGVNVEMISLGASQVAIDFVVQDSDRIPAVKALHRHLMVVTV